MPALHDGGFRSEVKSSRVDNIAANANVNPNTQLKALNLWSQPL